MALVTAIIPAALSLTVSCGLSIIFRKLLSHFHILAKRLHYIETLGTITLLAADKTGTLTQNALTVVHVFSCPQMDGATNRTPRMILPVLRL